MPLLNQADIAWLKVQFHPHRLKWLVLVCWPLALFTGFLVSRVYFDHPLKILPPIMPFTMACCIAWFMPWWAECFQWTLPLSPRRTGILLFLSQGMPIAILAFAPVILNWSEIVDPGKCCRVLLLALLVGGGIGGSGLWITWGRRSSRQRTQLVLPVSLEWLGPNAPAGVTPSMARHQWRIMTLATAPLFALWTVGLLVACNAPIGGIDWVMVAILHLVLPGAMATIAGAEILGLCIDETISPDNSAFVRTLPIRRSWALRGFLIRGTIGYLVLTALLLLIWLGLSHATRAERFAFNATAAWGLIALLAGACLGVFTLMVLVRLNSRGDRAMPDTAWILLMLLMLAITGFLAALLGGRWGVTVCMIGWMILAWAVTPGLDWEREA